MDDRNGHGFGPPMDRVGSGQNVETMAVVQMTAVANFIVLTII